MKKIIFTLKDEQLNIVGISKKRNKVSVYSEKTIYNSNFEDVINQSSDITYQTLAKDIGIFLSEKKLKGKDTEFIIALNCIISRTIEVPYLSKKKLEAYLKNNISNFFTANMDDYFYDYKIISVIPKTKESKKKQKIKLIIVPSRVIIGIVKLTEILELKMKSIAIYPDIVQRMVDDKQNVCVLDCNDNKSIITIFEQDSTFLYASFQSSFDNFDIVINEIEYFIDFYASRHQGDKLDYFHLIGSQSDNARFIERLTEKTGIPIQEMKKKNYHKNSKNIIDNYPLIVFSQQKNREINDKYIDFSKEKKLKPKKEKKFRPWVLFVFFIIITAAWYSGFDYYLKEVKQMYTYDVPKSDAYIAIQDEIVDLNSIKKEMMDKKEAVIDIMGTEFDYIEIIDVIFAAMPNDVTIRSLNMMRDSIEIDFNINQQTIDVLELVIALNSTEYFEDINITELELDDHVENITLVLKVIQ